jgi:hypothetical protein
VAGIEPLHRAPEGSAYASPLAYAGPLMIPLFQDNAKIMEKTTQPLARGR